METIETERRRRILVSLWAYAYEIEHTSLVSDFKFDEECNKINLQIDTGNAKLDKWFRKNFDPCTGMWVRKHPELNKLKRIFENVITGQ